MYNESMPKRLVCEPSLSYSRQLRKSQTPWEAKLWSRLRAHRFLGLQFKRQVQIGAVIVDFSCRAKKLAIELDGSQHNEASGKFTDNQKADLKKKYRKIEGSPTSVCHLCPKWRNLCLGEAPT